MIHKLAPGTFYGKKLRSHNIEGFRFTEWNYEQAAKAPRHSHECAYLNMVLQGGHVETLEKGEFACLPAVLVFHPPEEVHAGQISCSNTRIFDIEIPPPRLKGLQEIGLPLKDRMVFTGALPVWLATRLYHEFVRMDEVSPLVIEGLALELLAELGRFPAPALPSSSPRWLLQTRDLLHARFMDSLSLEEIARIVGVHPDHLAHAFRRQYHCTVGEYVRRLRIDFACLQMTSSDTPLAEIALDAGFADQSHFTKTFKRLMGMTPSEFLRHRRPSRLHTTG
jgi:AraC family transcriptional regulator